MGGCKRVHAVTPATVGPTKHYVTDGNAHVVLRQRRESLRIPLSSTSLRLLFMLLMRGVLHLCVRARMGSMLRLSCLSASALNLEAVAAHARLVLLYQVGALDSRLVARKPDKAVVARSLGHWARAAAGERCQWETGAAWSRIRPRVTLVALHLCALRLTASGCVG